MKLPIQSAANIGFTDAYELTAATITSTATGGQIVIGYLPAGGICTGAAVFEVTTSAGTSTDLVLDVGTTAADPDEMIDALDLDGLTKAAFNTGDVLVNTAAGYCINNTASAIPIYAEVNFTGTVTAGKWLIALQILDTAKLTGF